MTNEEYCMTCHRSKRAGATCAHPHYEPVKARIEVWSDEGGQWVIYGDFDSKEQADKFLTDRSYDLRFFREVTIE